MNDATSYSPGNAPSRGESAGRRWTLAALILLGALGFWFVRNALHYLSRDPAIVGSYIWPRRYGFYVHFAGGVTALALGLVQLWIARRRRPMGLHRRLGRVYVAAVAVGALGGYGIVGVPLRDHPVYGAGLLTFITAWWISAGLTWWSMRRRDTQLHRAWALRSYTLTFGFVTIRLGEKAFYPFFASPWTLDNLLGWAAWAIPLFILEVGLSLPKLLTRRTPCPRVSEGQGRHDSTSAQPAGAADSRLL